MIKTEHSFKTAVWVLPVQANSYQVKTVREGHYHTQKKASKSTLTFSCLLSSWCLCMKYWSLSCCLRSWCFSCRCRSSSSQIAASRAGKTGGSPVQKVQHLLKYLLACVRSGLHAMQEHCYSIANAFIAVPGKSWRLVFGFLNLGQAIFYCSRTQMAGLEERAWCWIPLMSCCLLLRQSRSIVASSVFCCWIIFFRDASSSCCCFCTNSCSW